VRSARTTASATSRQQHLRRAEDDEQRPDGAPGDPGHEVAPPSVDDAGAKHDGVEPAVDAIELDPALRADLRPRVVVAQLWKRIVAVRGADDLPVALATVDRDRAQVHQAPDARALRRREQRARSPDVDVAVERPPAASEMRRAVHDRVHTRHRALQRLRRRQVAVHHLDLARQGIGP
jgi:hypothetical protein